MSKFEFNSGFGVFSKTIDVDKVEILYPYIIKAPTYENFKDRFYQAINSTQNTVGEELDMETFRDYVSKNQSEFEAKMFDYFTYIYNALNISETKTYLEFYSFFINPEVLTELVEVLKEPFILKFEIEGAITTRIKTDRKNPKKNKRNIETLLSLQSCSSPILYVEDSNYNPKRKREEIEVVYSHYLKRPEDYFDASIKFSEYLFNDFMLELNRDLIDDLNKEDDEDEDFPSSIDMAQTYLH